MTAWIELCLALALLAAMALLSALETSVLNARRSRLQNMLPGKRLTVAEGVLESPELFQTSAHLAKSLCESVLYALAALLGMESRLRGAAGMPATPAELVLLTWPGIAAGSLIAYLFVTLFAEALPKAAAARSPEALLLRGAGFVRAFTALFTPVRWVTSRLARALVFSAGTDPFSTSRAAHSEEEIKLLVEGSAEEGVLEEEEKEMIQSIFEFTDTIARQVMVPRIDITSASVTATLADMVGLAMESGHSRLPVYEETLDRVVGILHVKDLLPHLAAGEHHIPVRSLMREPYFVPEGKKLDELLQEFRRQKTQLAIVVDEFGGTSGLVTVEDVLEEIVGEIEDEYDADPQPATEVGDAGDGTLVDARMTLEDVNEALELTLPIGEYDTLGGLVFGLLGRPPEVGEAVRHEDVEFVVEVMDGLRLQRIRVRLLPPMPPGPPGREG